MWTMVVYLCPGMGRYTSSLGPGEVWRHHEHLHPLVRAMEAGHHTLQQVGSVVNVLLNVLVR